MTTTATMKRAGDLVPGDRFYPAATAMNSILVARVERGPYDVVTIRYGYNASKRLVAAADFEFDYLGPERMDADHG